MSGELAKIIGEMDFDNKQDGSCAFYLSGASRYSRAIADGLLQRVRAGRTLFYGADRLLASAGFTLEDDALLEISLSETRRRDSRAEAAASVLGPQAVGHMIEAVLEVKKRLLDARGKYNQAIGDHYHDLLHHRIGHTPNASLIAAVCARSTQAGNEEMGASRHDLSPPRWRKQSRHTVRRRRARHDPHPHKRLGQSDVRGSGDATRGQLAEIAILASHAPSVELLPLLKRLLDEDLRRWRAFKEQARADQYRGGTATDEARMSWTLQYQRAFQAIGGPRLGTDARLSGGCRFRSSSCFGPRRSMDCRE